MAYKNHVEDIKEDFEEICKILSKYNQVERYKLLKEVHGFAKAKRDQYVEEQAGILKMQEDELNEIKNLEY